MSDLKTCGRCGQMTTRSPLCVDCEIYMKTHYELLPTDPILKRVQDLEARLERIVSILASNNKSVRIEAIYENALNSIADNHQKPSWDQRDERQIAFDALCEADEIKSPNETE